MPTDTSRYAGMLDRIVEEIRRGMPSEKNGRMKRAAEARDFYNGDGRQHMSEFMNDAETAADYIRRPYRESGLTKGVVNVLCEHLYVPGPARRWDEGVADELLQRVYQDNHINALMQRAEQLSTWGDCAAIQVDAAAGTYGDRPFTLRLWGADEFTVYPDPDDRLKPLAMVTVDKYDLSTRYRLWTVEEVRTFLTERAEGTAGGRVAEETSESPEPNPYGIIPFGFIHYTLPVGDFWEPGIGDLIVGAEIRVNDRLSRLDQSISKHLNPIPIVRDAPDNFQVILGQPNLFLRLNTRAQAPGGDGAFGGAAPPRPEMEYLEARIDIEGAWNDVRSYYNMILETVRVPQSAWRMEQTGVASGIALMVEQEPLLKRARNRQEPARIYEDRLARIILTCAGNYYGRAALTASAQKGRFEIVWPIPTTAVMTDDWLQLQLQREQAGLTSKIMITMEQYNVGRDQAIAILEQVKEDREEEEEVMPEPEPEPEPGEGGEDDGPDDGGDVEEDDA